MGGPVKSRRTYRSAVRAEAAVLTRTGILDSAQASFLGHGYAATSLGVIAARAGVSLASVKAIHGTKPALLLQVWHRRLAQVDDALPVHERQWFTEALAAPAPATLIARVAHNSATVKPRLAPLIAVIKTAAATDPDIAALWSRMQREFLANQRRIIAELDRRGALRPPLTAEETTDILWTLNHPETYLLLTAARRWPLARYEEWLAQTLAEQLLSQ